MRWQQSIDEPQNISRSCSYTHIFPKWFESHPINGRPAGELIFLFTKHKKNETFISTRSGTECSVHTISHILKN